MKLGVSLANRFCGLFFCACNVYIKLTFSQQCGLIPFSPPSDETFCTCDLLIDVCDVDCCCDGRCDASLFKNCLPIPTRNIPHSCTRFIQSNPTSTKLTEIYNFSLFCIHKTNYLNPDLYPVPRTLCTGATMDSIPLGRHFRHPTPLNSGPDLGMRTYERGDPIQTLYRDSTGTLSLGILTLPTADGSCVPRPLAYMEEHVSRCTSVFASNLEKSCAGGSLLDGRRYFENFNVSLAPMSNTTASGVCSARPTLKQTTCMDNDLGPINCSFEGVQPPTFNATVSVCRNSVKEVEYEFHVNETTGLARMFVSLFFQDVSLLDVPFTQTFTVRYLWSNETIIRTSPSYEAGQLIVAIRAVPMNASDGGMTVDSSKWLTMAFAGPDGRCSEETRIPLLFGLNMSSGCFIDFTLDNISRTCVNISDHLLNVVLPGSERLSHVAKYANSQAGGNLSGWIPIGNNTATLLQTFSNNVDGCNNMVSGLSIDVAFNRTGYIGSLVTEISSVTYNYETIPSFSFQCPASGCRMRNSTRRAEFATRVRFVDVSSPPTHRKLRKPTVRISLPEDFFFPFD